MTTLDIHLNHMAPGPVIRQRLIDELDIADVGDRRELDKAIYDENDQNGLPPPDQALYVVFAGEYSAQESSQGRGLDHLWLVFLRQRVDYDGWETDYGTLRANLICTLSGWQPGDDLTDLELVKDLSVLDQTPGLITDRTAWRLSQINFSL